MRVPAAEAQVAERTLSQIEGLERILHDTLQQQGLGKEQISLLAMHLIEIDEELDRYRQLLRAVSSAQSPDELLDALTEVLTALYHLDSHAQEAQPLLEDALGLFDPEDEP